MFSWVAEVSLKQNNETLVATNFYALENVRRPVRQEREVISTVKKKDPVAKYVSNSTVH